MAYTTRLQNSVRTSPLSEERPSAMPDPPRRHKSAAVRAATLAALLGIGTAVGPGEADDVAGDHDDHDSGTTPATSMPGMDCESHPDSLPHGLAVSRGGYTLVLADAELPADAERELEFVITGPDGEPVTGFDVAHEKLLHLVIVSRDLVGYAHIHPTLDDEGTWRVDVPPLAAGSYRVFADFVPTGASGMVLGADLAVPGDFDPAETPKPSVSARIDGYTVTFDGSLVAGTGSELTLMVEADGSPVEDLDPYLGALGHLVAIREGDMAYLHVHPIDEAAGPGGPEVRFAVEVPTPGTYRLFFDFSHGGEVRTAAVTFVASAAVAADVGMDRDMSTDESDMTIDTGMTPHGEDSATTMAMCGGH